ncbi:unnamed protein product [Owenia fusiformis]|uniref:Integrin alpha-2 domain-containing protein n=1 Tax=Owenia fusiformis TaxID=6347 RepID=A0A8S4P7B0_OWEFU|nr:unnamed protein product [Owenia fusiformis]
MYNSLDEEDPIMPCSGLPTTLGHEQYGYCQAGTSAALEESDGTQVDGDLLIGIPGPYHWTGGAAKKDLANEFTSTWYRSRMLSNKNKPLPPVSLYSYAGMSVAVAEFTEGKKTYLAGAPRSKDKGEVLLFHTNDTDDGLDIFNADDILQGELFSSLFGYDILPVDLNNDGKKDLIVSAPFYHAKGVGGVIYIYENDGSGINTNSKRKMIKSRKMPEKECMELNCEHARFGFSLAHVGDLNYDDFQDVAVGAPYEGRGVVYIFQGSRDGIKEEYVQRIEASDLITNSQLKSFGYSLSGGIDMDNNAYPDLVVGAYESNAAVILLSRPVIQIHSTVGSSPELIDPSITTCEGTSRDLLCFDVIAKFRFTAKPEDKFTERYAINYKIEAERFTGKRFVRVFFKNSPNPNDEDKNYYAEGRVQLYAQSNPSMKEIKQKVFVKKSNRDFLNPIQFKLTVELEENIPPPINPSNPNMPNLNQYPILDQSTSEVTFPVDFLKNCGEDQTCTSNQEVRAFFKDLEPDEDDSTVSVLSIGVRKELEVRVLLTNNGEDAHESTLTVTIPEKLSYIGTNKEGKKYGCDRVEMTTVVCENMGNPLKNGVEEALTLRFNPLALTPTPEPLEIHVQVNTTSKEIDVSDNSVILKLRAIVKAEMEVTASSDPEQVLYGGEVVGESAIRYEDEIGQPVTHTFQVLNKGSGTVPRSKLVIEWPYEVYNTHFPQGKHLLYIMQEPSVTNAKCTIDPKYVNPLGIELRVDRNVNEVGSNPGTTVEVDGATEAPYEVDTTEAQNLRRKKREAKYETVVKAKEISVGQQKIRRVDMVCNSTAKCFKIFCDLNLLRAQDSAVIRIRARLWNSTFVEDYRNVDQVLIRSRGTLFIDPALNIEQDKTDDDMADAITTAQPDIKIAEPPGIPLWIIIVAAIGGVLLLVILVIVLWKLGFFKRKRPEDMDMIQADFKKRKGKGAYDDDDM